MIPTADLTSAERLHRAVLTYGTLRPGWHNHPLVEDLVESTTPAAVEGYGLWVPRHRAFPYAYPAGPNTRTASGFLVGDVLRFSRADWPEALARMDSLEGHPSHYRRQVVETTDGEPVWLYVSTDEPMAAYGAWLLPSGDWTDVAGTRQPVR